MVSLVFKLRFHIKFSWDATGGTDAPAAQQWKKQRHSRVNGVSFCTVVAVAESPVRKVEKTRSEMPGDSGPKCLETNLEMSGKPNAKYLETPIRNIRKSKSEMSRKSGPKCLENQVRNVWKTQSEMSGNSGPKCMENPIQHVQNPRSEMSVFFITTLRLWLIITKMLIIQLFKQSVCLKNGKNNTNYF